MTIAVCVSGIASRVPEYKKILEQAKKVFPYDFFYQQWEGYPNPDVDNCLCVPEPTWDYHVVKDVKIKPDCTYFRKNSKIPDGKIYRSPGRFEHFRHTANQLVGHYYLVESLPEKYTKIIRMRFDSIVSTKIDYEKYLKMLDEEYTVGWATKMGVDCPGPGTDKDIEIRNNNGIRCHWQVYDQLVFHNRSRLKNVLELKKKQELNGCEWGWYQVLHHQWGDLKYCNILGGVSLVKQTKTPLQWDKF